MTSDVLPPTSGVRAARAARPEKTTGGVFLAVSMSLDGYVAGADDDVEPLHRWLFCDAVLRRLP